MTIRLPIPSRMEKLPVSSMKSASPERGGILTRFVALLFLAILLVVLFFFRYDLMAAAGRWLVVSDTLEPSNVIIQLSGDNYYADRAARAAQLYQAGWAPLVVASGGEIRPYLSECQLEEHDLELDGVPARAIYPFVQNDLYTLQEARDLLQLCRQKKWTRVIVVTSNYHTRRARYIFRHVFPSSIAVRVTPANDVDFNPAGWWKTRLGEKIFFREYAALCVAFWELHEPSHPQSR